MGRVIKPGKIVVLLSGRYAGKKAIVVKSQEEGNKDKPFPHALVVGLSKTPKRVNEKMEKKNFEKRTSVQVFIKYVNYQHLMPTRYVSELDFKSLVSEEQLSDKENKKKLKAELKNFFQEKWRNQQAVKKSAVQGVTPFKFFYTKLRF